MGNDSVVDPAARDKYLLQGLSTILQYPSNLLTNNSVTAGPSYDPSTHQDIPVNGPSNTIIESSLVTCYLKVRIKDYHGLPHGSPSTSPYFQHKLHTSDRYSIAFSFIPKRDLNGKDVVLGFDYDHSIKHQLPPGFKYAMKIATSMLDPGLYSDAYSDEPYLYGPALSGLFTLNIGDLISETSADEQLSVLESLSSGVVEEGSSSPSGASIRTNLSIPPKFKKRRKHFLSPENLEAFTFEKGRMYHADFFNPHLDFANFSLRLPGFSISVARYIDDKTHHLRYVLKDRGTGEVAFVVFFKLLFGEELDRVVGEKRGEDGQVESKDNEVVKRKESRPVEKISESTSITNGEKTPRQTVEKTEQPQPQPQLPQLDTEAEEDETGGFSPTAAVTSLTNNIYAAFVAMGLWDDTSSSSDEEAPAQDPSPHPSGRSLDARVDDLDDATVEKFLQSRQSNV
jgi:hypothetical protein